MARWSSSHHWKYIISMVGVGHLGHDDAMEAGGRQVEPPWPSG